MIKKRLAIVFFFLSCFILNVTGQNQKEIDSLNIIVHRTKSDTQKVMVITQIAKMFWFINPDTALTISNKALQIAKKAEFQKGEAVCYNSIGACYLILMNLPNALESFLNALKISSEINDQEFIALQYQNIGVVYNEMGDLNEALNYYSKSLQIAERLNIKYRILGNLNNIAGVYKLKGEKEKTLMTVLRSYELLKGTNQMPELCSVLSNISTAYMELNKDTLTLKYADEAYSIATKINNQRIICNIYFNYGWVYSFRNDKKNSLIYYEKALKLAKELNHNVAISKCAENLYSIYKSKNNIAKSLEYLELAKHIKDSLFNDEKKQELNKLQLRYEREENKKDQIISAQKAEKQKLLIIAISIIVLILVFTLTYIYRRLQLTRRQKKIIEQQNHLLTEKNEEIAAQAEEIAAQRDNLEVFNEELTEKNEEISAQRDSLNALNSKLTDTNEQLEMLFEIATERKNEIEKKNKDITSSITYASRIQQALLPPDEMLDDTLPEHFILYKPRDIVSGDFYWCKQVEHFVYLVAADCTGHGVPGAFMSMLGISLLNDIVKDKVLMQPHIILNKLRERIKISLHQSGQKGETQDGMDIAVCVIDLQAKKLDFAGAYNPLYLYRKNGETFDFIETKADRMPIGIHPKDDQDFTTRQLQLQAGDSIYIFSDGFTSQFGSDSKETFKSHRFRKALQDVQTFEMKQQKEELNKILMQWQGKHDQVDDILVVGLRMN